MDKMNPFKIGKGRTKADINIKLLKKKYPRIKFCPHHKIKLTQSLGGDYFCPECGYMI